MNKKNKNARHKARRVRLTAPQCFVDRSAAQFGGKTIKTMLMLMTVAFAVSGAVYADGSISPSPELSASDINLPRSNWLFATSSPNEGAQAELVGDVVRVTPPGGNFIYSISGGWTFDNPGTAQTETHDLSYLANIVVGVKGGIYTTYGPVLGMSLEDSSGASSGVALLSVSNSNEQYWSVPMTNFSAIDVTRVKKVTFGVGYTYNASGTHFDIRTVPPTTNPCLIKVQAGGSIQDAVNQVAGDGCVIWVDEGTYAENITIGQGRSDLKNLTIAGASMEKTVIQGSVAIDFTDQDGNQVNGGVTSVQDLKITNANWGVTVVNQNVVLDRLRVTGNQIGIIATSIQGDAIAEGNPNVKIQHSVLDNNTIGVSLYIANELRAFLVNNTIVDNSFVGVFAQLPGPQTHHLILVNNVISRNFIGMENHSAQNAIVKTLYEYNDNYGNTAVDIQGVFNFVGDQGTNLHVDPLFVNPAAGDYRLRRGSPMINAGDPVSPRDPNGTRADIGALPFQGIRVVEAVDLNS